MATKKKSSINKKTKTVLKDLNNKVGFNLQQGRIVLATNLTSREFFFCVLDKGESINSIPQKIRQPESDISSLKIPRSRKSIANINNHLSKFIKSEGFIEYLGTDKDNLKLIPFSVFREYMELLGFKEIIKVNRETVGENPKFREALAKEDELNSREYELVRREDSLRDKEEYLTDLSSKREKYHVLLDYVSKNILLFSNQSSLDTITLLKDRLFDRDKSSLLSFDSQEQLSVYLFHFLNDSSSKYNLFENIRIQAIDHSSKTISSFEEENLKKIKGFLSDSDENMEFFYEGNICNLKYQYYNYKLFDSINVEAYSNNDIENVYSSTLDVYVDGSFSPESKRCSYGAVVFDGDNHIDSLEGEISNALEIEDIYKSFGVITKFEPREFYELRNIAGELSAAVKSLDYCLEKGYKSINLFFDFEGIETFRNYTGSQQFIKSYSEYLNKIGKDIDISFSKITSKKCNRHNLADNIARSVIS